MTAELALIQERTLQVEWGLRQRPTPSLVAYASLLQLSSLDVAELVEQELAVNPALDRDDPERCDACGFVLLPSGCASCRAARVDPARPGLGGDVDIASVPQAPDPLQMLRRDLAACLEPAQLSVAEYLLSSLDGRGFLRDDPAELAAEIGVESSAVERAIAAIRSAGPEGICARDLRECLLLQLEARPSLVTRHPILPQLLRDHLEDLAGGRFAAIASELGCDREAIVLARDAIRSELRPCALLDESRPARTFRHTVGGESADVVVSRRSDSPAELLVEVVERQVTGLSLSPDYIRLTEQAPGRAPAADVALARRDVQRGKIFLQRLEQRWRTVDRVATEVTRRQRPFILHDSDEPAPLTRVEIARTIGVHESTVSRATQGKTMLLPDGRTVGFAALFGTAPGPREALRRIIVAEPRPLSDQALADELTRRGHPVARRTVAKYRTLLGQPAAAHR